MCLAPQTGNALFYFNLQQGCLNIVRIIGNNPPNEMRSHTEVFGVITTVIARRAVAQSIDLVEDEAEDPMIFSCSSSSCCSSPFSSIRRLLDSQLRHRRSRKSVVHCCHLGRAACTAMEIVTSPVLNKKLQWANSPITVARNSGYIPGFLQRSRAYLPIYLGIPTCGNGLAKVSC